MLLYLMSALVVWELKCLIPGIWQLKQVFTDSDSVPVILKQLQGLAAQDEVLDPQGPVHQMACQKRCLVEVQLELHSFTFCSKWMSVECRAIRQKYCSVILCVISVMRAWLNYGDFVPGEKSLWPQNVLSYYVVAKLFPLDFASDSDLVVIDRPISKQNIFLQVAFQSKM